MNEAKMTSAGKNNRFLKPFKRKVTSKAPEVSNSPSTLSNISKPTSFTSSSTKRTKSPSVSTSIKVIKKPNDRNNSTSIKSKTDKNTSLKTLSNTIQSPLNPPMSSQPSIFLPKKPRR